HRLAPVGAVGWSSTRVKSGHRHRFAAPATDTPGDPLALAEALGKVLAVNRAGLGAAARAHALEHFELGAVVDAWQHLVAEVWTAGAETAG
ncbi:hypothetical protein ABZW03_22120, partial [Kitasatospora sp. NPDC004799]|uniref:hypothetical protein n=1 Tax=Kitasatospora sp. NPDC004799 TaxID=3154460 RepID=UPI0033AA03CE